jgi:flavin reductase (DIM6/NTAB) family NADH-FMN oxidoreductase RutF
MQVSFQPPLVAVAIESDSHMRRVIEREKRFSINFLPADGLETARAFAKPATSGMNDTRGVEFSKNGFLFVRAAAGSFGCAMIGAHETGDHVTFVGEVVEASDHPAGPVLTQGDTGWTYRK